MGGATLPRYASHGPDVKKLVEISVVESFFPGESNGAAQVVLPRHESARAITSNHNADVEEQCMILLCHPLVGKYVPQ